jgi:uncharacterized protein DUF222
MFDSVVERLRGAARTESRAAGQRLAVIGELDLLWLRRFGERETWGTDSHDAITAEIAAALGITRGLADSYLDYARAMRVRLPRVGALLVAGDIDYRTFQTIVYRTELITDADVLAAVDAQLATRVARWTGITQGRLGAYVDRVVARADRDAVRRRRERRGQREVAFFGDADGVSEIFGRLHTTDAHALDARLDAVAATVCAADPRTRQQRRADALGALAAGADRLVCRCGRPGCPAFAAPPPSPVVIHVIAEQATVDGTGQLPGSMIGADALIPAELLAELARSATLRPLIHPADAPPEAGYTPSRALADFIRCRDLTCRFPGCEEPATRCDLDHTVPHGDGGPTHASNLKALCRRHHLLKTFWGWHDQQLPDGTVIWTSPAEQIFITTPGSALLFPTLCTPTATLSPGPHRRHCAGRTAMMPKRQRTRTQNRARYIATERQRNHQARHAVSCGPAPPSAGDEPPPF